MDAQTDHVIQFKVGKRWRDVAAAGRHPNAPRYIPPGVAEGNAQKSKHRTKTDDLFSLTCTGNMGILDSHIKSARKKK